jgi:hypothetical protein
LAKPLLADVSIWRKTTNRQHPNFNGNALFSQAGAGRLWINKSLFYLLFTALESLRLGRRRVASSAAISSRAEVLVWTPQSLARPESSIKRVGEEGMGHQIRIGMMT